MDIFIDSLKFDIKSNSAEIQSEIDAKLEEKSICKDAFLGGYRSSCSIKNSSDEKHAIREQVKSDIISVIQQIANDKNTEITIENLFVAVDCEIRQMTTPHQKIEYGVVVGNDKPITIRPRK